MIMSEFNRILILAPHTDDAEIGCGASIHKWLLAGKEVHYIAFSAAEESVPSPLPKDTLRKEAGLATACLGLMQANVQILHYPVRRFDEHRQLILEGLVTVQKELQPDLILLPSQSDIHQDHQ